MNERKKCTSVVGLYFQRLARKGGGAERMLCWLANELAAKGYEVHVLSWDPEGAKSFYPLAAEIKWHRLDFAQGFRDKLRRTRAMRRVLLTEQIDTLIGFVMAGDMTVFTAARTSGVRIIAAERNAPSMYSLLYSRTRRRLNLAMLRLADRIIVQSEAFRAGYPSSLENRIVAIPNPVSQPTHVADPAGPEGTRRTVLYVGRLDLQQKRPDYLVTAFGMIAERHPDWDLILVGDGPARECLTRQIEKLELKHRVRLVPTTPDIGAVYEDAQLFVMPSSWEGFPNALAEAMSHGLPAIGFADAEGVATLLGMAGGWLVPGRDDPEELARIMDSAMDDPEARLRRGADARLAMDAFDPDRVLAAWEQIIDRREGENCDPTPPEPNYPTRAPALVTVGITSHNSSNTLRKALASALAQDWPNTEVLVVDDCSTDGSFALLEAWAAEDPGRRRVLRQPENGGVAQARNRIIAEANGAFICFLDDDDISAPDRVTRQMDRIVRYENEFAHSAPVICHAACRRYYSDGSMRLIGTFGCRTGRTAPHGPAVARRVLLGEPVVDAYGSTPTCSQMARASTYALVGGFDGGLRRSEDTDLVIRLALAGAHFVGIDTPLVEQTMTATDEKSIAIEHRFAVRVLEKHRAFIDRHGHFGFERRWLETKHLWFLRRRRAFLVAISNLLLHHPRRTVFRLGMALPRLRENQMTRMFRHQIRADAPKHSDYRPE